MRRATLARAASLLFVVAACSSSKPVPAAEAEPAFRATGTIKDIMDSVVDPNADVLWESVSTTINREGTTEKHAAHRRRLAIGAPQRRDARRSHQPAGHRRPADGRPGDKSENPDIELGT